MDKVFVFLQLLLLVSSAVAAEAAVLSAFVGGDCVLPCSAPQGEVLVLEWTFSGKHLLFYRSGKILKNQQAARFRERAELKDPTAQSVDVTLRDVRDDDNGTYVCEGLVQTPEGRQRFTNMVQLHVGHGPPEIKAKVEMVRTANVNENPEKQTSDEDALMGLKIAIPLSAVGLICLTVIGLVHFRRKQMKREKSDPSNAAAAPEKSDTSEPPSPTDSLSPLLRQA